MLKEVFTPAVCAQCRLCCSFWRADLWEAPFLPENLVERWRKEGKKIEERPNGGWGFCYEFATGDPEEIVYCPALDRERGCTLPPEEKPFECSVWPLRVMRRDGRLVIGLYRDCPGAAGGNAGKLAALARGKLLPLFLDHARRHPAAVRAFAPEYDVVWEE